MAHPTQSEGVTFAFVRLPATGPACGAFLLGIPFAVAGLSGLYPSAGRAAWVTAEFGSVVLSIILLLALAIGRATPIALGAFVVGWLENPKALSLYRRGFEIAGGLRLIRGPYLDP